MVFKKQGQKTGVKGFTYRLDDNIDSGRAAFFQAGVKENANVWLKHYTSDAAFETADSTFGSAGQIGGQDVRTQTPSSGKANTGSSDLFTAHQVPDGTEVNKLTNLSGNAHRGLTFAGTNLWIIGSGSDTAYEIDTSGADVSNVSVPTSGAEGLTWDGEYLWTCNSSGDIYQFQTSNGNQVSHVNASTGTDLRGMAFDGSYLYIGDGTNDVIGKFKTDGTRVSTFSENNPDGLTFDGKYIWSSDATNGDLRQFTKSGTSVSSFASKGSDNDGLAWDGSYLWQVSGSDQTVYQITGSASLDLSYQVSGFFTSQALSGTVYLNNTSNGAQNAYVFAIQKNSDRTFIGSDLTDANGDYQITGFKDGKEYAVGVDFLQSSSNTRYGRAKSISFG